MDTQKEAQMCFDIDQNKQKINYLLKKFKNIPTRDELNLTNDKITGLEEAIEEIGSAGSTQTEDGPYGIYDYYKMVDNTYRDNLWEPKYICFADKVGTRTKIRIKFLIKNTVPASTPVNAKTTVRLDNEIIYEDTHPFEGEGTHQIDFEYVYLSKQAGHYISIRVYNGLNGSKDSTYTKPDYFEVEIWGTDVQFVSRPNDFSVAFSDIYNAMTTTCIDEKCRLSVQRAESTLNFDTSEFRTMTWSSRRVFNNITPFYDYNISDGTIVYEDAPGLVASIYYLYGASSSEVVKNKLTEDETTVITGYWRLPGLTQWYAFNGKIDGKLGFISVSNTELVFYATSDGNTIQQIYNMKEKFADCCGIIPYKNATYNENNFILTRLDGTTFFCTASETKSTDLPKLELGFGTNVNAYVVEDGTIEVYMRVNADVKKVILRKVDGEWQIDSTDMLPGIQEYWRGANNTYFMRRGSDIEYYTIASDKAISKLKVF